MTTRDLVAIALACLACQSPTEIMVEISTNVPCASLGEVAITTGPSADVESQAPSTTTTMCDPQSGTVGSIAVVPSGAIDDLVAIKVTARVKQAGDTSSGPCVAPYGPSCIVARRSLKFVSHTMLHLPIKLDGACTGLVCAPDETCDLGVCRPVGACDSSGCTPADAGTPVVVQGCGDMRGLQTDAQWPMLGYCPTRLGRGPYSGPHGAQPTPISVPLGIGPLTSAVIGADGTVYVAGDTALVALNPDLTVKWKQAIDGPTASVATDTSPVIAADGAVWIGSSTGELFSVTQASAISHAVDFYFGTPVIDPSGTLIFPTKAGSVRGIDLGGAPVFDVPVNVNANVNASIHSAPARASWDGSIFVGTQGQLLVDVHPPSSFTLGDVGTPFYDFETPLVHPSGLIFASVGDSQNENIAAFDSSGKPLWSVALPGAPHLSNGAAVGPDGRLYVSTSDGIAIVAITNQGTTPVSLGPSPDGARTPSIGADGTVYVGVGASMFALDASGQVLFGHSVPATNTIESSPAIGKNGWLYFTDTGGIIYALHD